MENDYSYKLIRLRDGIRDLLLFTHRINEHETPHFHRFLIAMDEHIAALNNMNHKDEQIHLELESNWAKAYHGSDGILQQFLKFTDNEKSTFGLKLLHMTVGINAFFDFQYHI